MENLCGIYEDEKRTQIELEKAHITVTTPLFPSVIILSKLSCDDFMTIIKRCQQT